MVVTSGMMAPAARCSSSSSSIGGCAGSCGVLWAQRRGGGVRCAAASAGGSLPAQYRTLRVQHGASELEVKKAFRQLALQYHPDVCKGSNCSVQFHSINEAYDIVMSSLRQAKEETAKPLEWNGDGDGDGDNNELMRGEWDPNWDLWEEWMGWEGAGIRDYSSHINPYI